MKQPRIYHPETIAEDDTITLTDFAYQHAIVVLRQKVGDIVRLFDCSGYDFFATITEIKRREAVLRIDDKVKIEKESPQRSILLQGISKNDRMDLALQKATELGVTEIMPITSRYSDHVKNSDKKQTHWQKVIIHACEQSGRSVLPVLHSVSSLSEALSAVDCKHRLVMTVDKHDAAKSPQTMDEVALLVGPISGLSAEEEQMAFDAGFTPLHLGKRVLRTETAAIVGLTYCQLHGGDFAQTIKGQHD